MASPFRYNKKTRRRMRKLAKSLANEMTLEKWDDASADSFRRIAKLTEKQANAKRRNKRPLKSK
jgi:hypothetical protein